VRSPYVVDEKAFSGKDEIIAIGKGDVEHQKYIVARAR
jgi:hypothetical protein